MADRRAVLGEPDHNSVQSNVASTNPLPGTHVGNLSTNNVLQGNTALANGVPPRGSDLRDDDLKGANNTWKGNTFMTNSEGDGWGKELREEPSRERRT